MTEPPLPQTSSDERAVGWGDEGEDEPARSDEERLRAERPPHHDRD